MALPRGSAMGRALRGVLLAVLWAAFLPAASAAQGPHAFSMLDLARYSDFFADAEHIVVSAINNDGDVAGYWIDDSDVKTAFYWSRADWDFHSLPATFAHSVILDMNNTNPPTVVGWTLAQGQNQRAMKWTVGDQDVTYLITANDTAGEAWSINDSGDIVGWADDGQNLVGWLGGGGSPVQLAIPTNSTGEAALSISNRFGSPLTVWISGVTDGPPSGYIRPTIWKNHDQVWHLPPAQQPTGTAGWMATAVTTDGHVAGWRIYDGGATTAAFWERTGANAWSLLEATTPAGAGDRGVGMNALHEVVLPQSLWAPLAANIGRTLIPVHNHVSIPLHLDTEDWELAAINDDGVMAGVAHRVDDGSEGRPTLIVVLPHDTNNNGIPDYREILDDEQNELDDNDNWVLDSAERFRPGLFALGQRVLDVEHANVYRTHKDAWQLTADNNNCGDTHDDLIRLIDPNDANGQVLVMFRSRCGQGEREDCIPETVQQRRAVLNPIRNFFFRFGSHVDFFQTGNEFVTGPGQFYFHDKPGWFLSGNEGFLRDVVEQYIEDACHEVTLWLSDLSQGMLEGCYRGGHRPVRIVGPVNTGGQIRFGWGAQDAFGSRKVQGEQGWQAGVDDRNRAAYTTLCAIKASNQYAQFVAANDHYAGWEEIYNSATRLIDSSQNCAWARYGVVPIQYVFTEWGPKPSDAWWDNQSQQIGKSEASKYYISCSGTPIEQRWRDFIIEKWHTEDEVYENGPADFYVNDAMDLLASLGFVFGCHGNYAQPGECNDERVYDMSALWANQIKDDHLDNSQDPTNRFTPFREFFEDAAQPHQVAGWEAHPEPLPGNPCGGLPSWPLP